MFFFSVSIVPLREYCLFDAEWSCFVFSFIKRNIFVNKHNPFKNEFVKYYEQTNI